jgi:hypothetical protein
MCGDVSQMLDADLTFLKYFSLFYFSCTGVYPDEIHGKIATTISSRCYANMG